MNEIEVDLVEILEMIYLEIIMMKVNLLLTRKLIIHLMIHDLNDERRKKVDLIFA